MTVSWVSVVTCGDIGNLGMPVHKQGMGQGGTEGCTGMLVQMNTGDGKDVQVDYIQEPGFRSSKQLLEIAQN